MVKLVRLIRLPRIIRIFNVKSFKKVLTVFVSGDTRSERITSQISVRKIYAIIRLILLAVVICYFVSVLFFFYSDSFNIDQPVPHDEAHHVLMFPGFQ